MRVIKLGEKKEQKKNKNQKPEPEQEEPKSHDQIDKLKKELEEKQKKIEELTDTLKRVQAEFINYKNRTEKENVNFKEYAKVDLLKNLLPLLDSFELALKQKEKKEDFIEGMELIYAQFINILKQEGVEPIDTEGKKFDPYKHEVLLKSKSDMESETIIEELQKGYLFKGKVLRHSKVKISE
ncbi:nucleotide exchange factor GrpE [Candidatus Woesearchaeota archaeon]|nr:nucleotide exchange factor GrpE [Candidatus Woesearchaeota archaeon]